MFIFTALTPDDSVVWVFLNLKKVALSVSAEKEL